jgi:hypothetical protein
MGDHWRSVNHIYRFERIDTLECALWSDVKIYHDYASNFVGQRQRPTHARGNGKQTIHKKIMAWLLCMHVVFIARLFDVRGHYIPAACACSSAW